MNNDYDHVPYMNYRDKIMLLVVHFSVAGTGAGGTKII